MRIQLPSITSIRENIDVYLARAGVVLGLIAALLSGIIGHGDIIDFGLLSATISVVYLLYVRKARAGDRPKEPGLARTPFLLLSIIFTLSLAATILFAGRATYVFPVPYYVAAAMCYGVIAVQVLLMKEEQKGVIYASLIELLVISLVVRFAPVYTYAELLGSDPWGSLSLYGDIANYGYIPEYWSYSSFPFFHYVESMFQFVTGLGFKASLAWSIGLLETLSLVFVFLTGRLLAGNKVGLLYALFIGFNEYHIEWGGRSLIAMSLGIVFFSLITYLVIKAWKTRLTVFRIILLVSMLSLVLTHTLSSLVLFVLLTFLYLGFKAHEWVFGAERKGAIAPVAWNLTLFFSVSMLAYWMYASGFFLSLGRAIGYALDVARGELVLLLPVPYGSVAELAMSRATYLILIELTILGALFWLSQKFRKPERTMLLMFILAVFIILTAGDYIKIDVLLPDRWYVFYYLIMGIPIAFALVEMARSFRVAGTIVSAAVVLVLSFLMVTSPIANVESPLYHPHSRSAFWYSEIASLEWIERAHSGPVITDILYGRAAQYGYGHKIWQLDESIFEEGSYPDISSYVVRKYIIDYSLPVIDPEKTAGYSSKRLDIGEEVLQHFEEGEYNRIYDSGTVWIYQ